MSDTARESPRRQQALDFIRTEIAAGREFPSTSAIARHMGWSNAKSAKDCLDKLCYRDGSLRCDTDARGRRSYRLPR